MESTPISFHAVERVKKDGNSVYEKTSSMLPPGCMFVSGIQTQGGKIHASVEYDKIGAFSPNLLQLRADDEPVDPKKYLEEACKPKCVKPLLEYQACVKRIQGDESGHKHCTGQYFDYWSCVDKCVALKLFAKLK